MDEGTNGSIAHAEMRFRDDGLVTLGSAGRNDLDDLTQFETYAR